MIGDRIPIPHIAGEFDLCPCASCRKQINSTHQIKVGDKVLVNIQGEVTKLDPFGVPGTVEVFFREAKIYVPVENINVLRQTGSTDNNGTVG